MNEPQIIINGQTLSNAQAMTMRVAISCFFTEHKNNPTLLGSDEHGLAMTQLYAKRAEEVLKIMHVL